MNTNATDTAAATVLQELTEMDQGTLFSALVQKMGQSRGPKGAKVIYGDDRVQVLIWTGFSNQALIERSQKMLNREIQRGGYIERLARATLEEHEDTKISDVCEAMQETRDWFRRVLAWPDLFEPNFSRDQISVWEPLTVEGVRVRGARVYTGQGNKEDPRAPVPGSIYVSGVKLGEMVITPAANGPWRPDSKPKTVAKALLKKSLPVGLYCQYRLDPERVMNLAVGKKAAKAAKAEGVSIDPDALRSLFKIAP